jgi:intein-encoded DNA endonuclease-like protein
MSMMGELTFFLGIQVNQTKQGTFEHQAKYTKDLIKKFINGGAQVCLYS